MFLEQFHRTGRVKPAIVVTAAAAAQGSIG